MGGLAMWRFQRTHTDC